MGTTVIESVFTNKLLTTYKPKDVQMTENHKETNKLQSTKQRQLEYLKSLRYQSATDVSEPGIVRDLLFVF
jgi:hypothetical protein